MGICATQDTERRVRACAAGWWKFSASEVRAHAILAAVVMWAIAVIALLGPGYRSIFGPLKGGDFIHFYTLAHIDRTNATDVLYDIEAFHRLQVGLVPESARERYPTVYPPHAAILFRPLASLSYGTAFFVWASILIASYAGCVWLAWRPFRTVLGDRRLLIAAGAAFPPFWFMVLHGQTTIVPLVAFSLAWMALSGGRRFWAGCALGLLLLKPQFVLVLIPVVLACGEWAMLTGAAACIAVQLIAIVTLLGAPVLWDYVDILMKLPQVNQLLEPRPEQMHSLTALTNRLPGEWGALVWVALAGLVIARTIQVWRSAAPLSARIGILIVASTLVNVHLFVYDATVLAPALIWLAAWLYGNPLVRPETRRVFNILVYALFVAFLAPTAGLITFQASVLFLGGLFFVMTRSLIAVAGEVGELAALPVLNHR